ncbi:MAG: hypothetical protein Q7T82_00010 [Armatimonadota bacterium]|nr:hypothetical protein [Armatimonadota bacterium]
MHKPASPVILGSMLCPSCRNENAAEAAFCEVCSEVLRKSAGAAQTVAVPARAQVVAVKRDFPSPVLLGAAVALFLVFCVIRPWLAAVFQPLDWVNLAFHEGGHIIFGVLGSRFIMVLGGTLMQLLLPAAAGVHFWTRSQRVSAVLMLVWLGQNFFGIGKYIADARAQQLELVAGGVHDWTYLLETVGLLTHDVGIGRGAEIFGCLVMSCGLILAFHFHQADRS